MNRFIPLIFFCIFFHFTFLDAKPLFKKENSITRMQTISEDIDQAKELFLKLGNLSAQIKKSTFFAEKMAPLNRCSFYPFDETRCCREIEDFYISASDISTPLQNYVIAQAPIETTVTDFWKMIIYKKCNLIVTACMPIEFNRDRCTPYWEKPFIPDNILGWDIYFIEEKTLHEGPDLQRIVARYFVAHHVITNIKRKITQLHLENWPDYSVPNLSLFQNLLNLVDEHSKESPTPILVHCSAGVGRSGTFVASHSLRKELLAGENEVNIPQRIYDLRLQRASVVSTPKQFQFIYKSLLIQ